jgi:hypothetical protein
VSECAGTIVLKNSAGRALRKGPASVCADDVLDCVGGFAVGDTVYVSFRAVDGGQYVVATGVARCDERALRRLPGESQTTFVVLHVQEVKLLWP